MTDFSLFNLTCCLLTIFSFFFSCSKSRRSTSHYLAIKISHTDFQMKMEDMPLSGPDNTKLEVSASPTRQTLCLSSVLFCVFWMIFHVAGFGPWHLLWAGGRRLFGPVFWGTSGCETRLFLPGWNGPREHEGVRWVPRTSTLLCSNFSLVCLLPAFNLLLFQKLWTSQEWTYLAKCTISGKTKSASVRTAKDWSRLLASPHTWRNVWAWDATAAASPTAGRSVEVIQESLLGMNIWSDCCFFSLPLNRLASNNNMSKSESDQEDNDDLNDNDWSYGAEKKG